jgi:hypothetical protein
MTLSADVLKKIGAKGSEHKTVGDITTADRRGKLLESVAKWVQHLENGTDWEKGRRYSRMVGGERRVSVYYGSVALLLDGKNIDLVLGDASKETEIAAMKAVSDAISSGGFDDQISKAADVMGKNIEKARAAKKKKAEGK